MNTALGKIALGFPGDEFRDKGPFVGQTTAQTLLGQNAEFNFSHIQPGGMNWREVKAQTVHDPVGFLLTEKLNESMIMMGVQVIHDHIDAVRIRIEYIHQIAHRIGEVLLLATTSDQDMPLVWLKQTLRGRIPPLAQP